MNFFTTSLMFMAGIGKERELTIARTTEEIKDIGNLKAKKRWLLQHLDISRVCSALPLPYLRTFLIIHICTLPRDIRIGSIINHTRHLDAA